MEVPNASHPVWGICRVALMVVALALCLKYNYSTFDPTKDVRAILILAICGATIETIMHLFIPGKPPSDDKPGS